MKDYLDLLEKIKRTGVLRGDRTGTGTYSIFGHQMRFNLRNGFPIVTTKKIFMHGIIHELLWFISGGTNVRYLQKHGVHIWDEWADSEGELGPVYGSQWRNWRGSDGDPHDQLKDLITGLKEAPDSRRHIISAWNVSDISKMALPPCHTLFQFYVADNRLSCQLYQRSADVFLGLPFNIASYALLTMMIAQVTDLEPGEFILALGDAHLYVNHIEQTEKQLGRKPYPLPQMVLNPDVKNLEDFMYKDFILNDYRHHKGIKAPIAV